MQLMPHPVVSVIIPVYNVERYLACCLDSVVEQTYQNLDIILINDGSTDKSGEICRKYRQKDMRIRLFEQENMGLSVARNIGIDNMRGDYIVFIDSDDCVNRYMIEILLEKILKYDVPVVVCNYLSIGEECDGTELGVVFEDGANLEKKMNRDEVFDCMGTQNCIKFIVAYAKIYHKKIFEKLRFPIGKIHEDEFIFHKVYGQVDVVYYIDLQLYGYRQSRNSIMRKNGARGPRSADVLKEMGIERLSFFQEYGNPKYIQMAGKILFREYIHNLVWLDKQELKKKASELELEIYNITGKRILWFRFFMVKYFPEVYQFMRKHYRRLRNISSFRK